MPDGGAYKCCRNGFMRVLIQEQKIRDEEGLEQQKEDAEKTQKRLAQIDTIIRKLLEQNAAGVISDERLSLFFIWDCLYR